MSVHWEERRVVVIGAGRGIGAATAELLVARGARVLIADCDRDVLEHTRARLARAGGDVTAMLVDVRDPEGLHRLLAAGRAALGDLDTVVNCAAIVRPALVGTTSPDNARDEVTINLLGTILVAEAFVPYFRTRRRGHLVLIASLGGVMPMAGGAVYSATKFGVRGFALSLGLELRGTGVRVSVVHPDSVDTRQLRAEARHERSAISFTSPPMTAADVAAAIVRTVRHPRVEVFVPPVRGFMVKLVNVSPALVRTLYPALEAIGQRARRRFLQRRIEPLPVEVP